MRNVLVIVALVLCVALLSRCSESPVDGGGGGGGANTEADSIAGAWFQILHDTVTALGGREMEEVRDSDFSNIRGGFESALAIQASNSIAHLGLSILEILELNYSSDVWEVVDSLASWGGGLGSGSPIPPGRVSRGPIIGRQFSLLVEVPFSMYVRRVTNFPPNITIDRIQQIIANTIIPALDRAITHMETTEDNTDTKITLVIHDNGVEETIIIDLGEIYVFDASVHALRAAFGVAIAYDLDLFGPDGTYGWIDDVSRLEDDDIHCNLYDIHPGAEHDTLYLYWLENSYGSVQGESIMVRVLNHNLENRSDFLGLRQGGAVMASAHQDLISVIGKLEDSVHFIKHVRKGETEHNVIKLTDLTDMESGLGDPDGPNFAKNFRSLENVLSWIEDFVSGPVEFTEKLGSSQVTVTWTMDVSSLFVSPVQNWKDLLPYHRWALPAGPWIGQRENWMWYQYHDPMYEYWDYVYHDGYCQDIRFDNVTYIYWYSIQYELNLGSVIELLDGPDGDPINLELEHLPYFPDYTLHGLFPGMTRSSWLELMDNLQ